MAEPNSIPIACTLTPTDLQERKSGSLTALFEQVKAVQSLPNGYAFQFPSSDDIVAQLFQFVQQERQCCAFFQFDLSFAPQNGEIWLKLTGGEGVKAFIEAEIGSIAAIEPI